MAMNSPILAGEDFSAEKQQQIAEQFFHHGYVHIPDVPTAGEIAVLRNKTARRPGIGPSNQPSSGRCQLCSVG